MSGPSERGAGAGVARRDVDEQAEYHDEAQRNHPFGFLDEDGGRQEQRILQEAKVTLHAALVQVGGDALRVAAYVRIGDGAAADKAGLPLCLSSQYCCQQRPHSGPVPLCFADIEHKLIYIHQYFHQDL